MSYSHAFHRFCSRMTARSLHRLVAPEVDDHGLGLARGGHNIPMILAVSASRALRQVPHGRDQVLDVSLAVGGETSFACEEAAMRMRMRTRTRRHRSRTESSTGTRDVFSPLTPRNIHITAIITIIVLPKSVRRLDPHHLFPFFLLSLAASAQLALRACPQRLVLLLLRRQLATELLVHALSRLSHVAPAAHVRDRLSRFVTTASCSTRSGPGCTPPALSAPCR